MRGWRGEISSFFFGVMLQAHGKCHGGDGDKKQMVGVERFCFLGKKVSNALPMDQCTVFFGIL
jgi:hypothetical protein